MTGMDRDRFHLFLRHKNNTTEEDKEKKKGQRWMKMSEKKERKKKAIEECILNRLSVQINVKCNINKNWSLFYKLRMFKCAWLWIMCMYVLILCWERGREEKEKKKSSKWIIICDKESLTSGHRKTELNLLLHFHSQLAVTVAVIIRYIHWLKFTYFIGHQVDTFFSIRWPCFISK